MRLAAPTRHGRHGASSIIIAAGGAPAKLVSRTYMSQNTIAPWTPATDAAANTHRRSVLLVRGKYRRRRHGFVSAGLLPDDFVSAAAACAGSPLAAGPPGAASIPTRPIFK